MLTDRYDEGIDANAEGLPETACPYPEQSPERVHWLRGWRDFAPIRAEWEESL